MSAGVLCLFFDHREKAMIAEKTIWKNLIKGHAKAAPSSMLCVDSVTKQEKTAAEIEEIEDCSPIQIYGIKKNEIKKEVRAVRWGNIYEFSDGTFFIYKPEDASLMDKVKLSDIIAEKYILFEGENGSPIEA